MTKHQRFESEMTKIGLADHFCSNFFMRKLTGEGYLHQVCDDFWTVWNAGKSDPVPLPPMIDIEGLEGEHLNAANHFNAAIAMCSIAIRKAGYPSECSPMFYPTDKQGG
ncbi:hypothetical protein [Yersinia rochesterensis]|uniref:hypothetical protein n=1 Tax=Yersinia rochesterensis TaxID=1604335 RepID=UPI0011A70B9D|nr:hypothetical protein [Yersinia rochesterensis]